MMALKAGQTLDCFRRMVEGVRNVKTCLRSALKFSKSVIEELRIAAFERDVEERVFGSRLQRTNALCRDDAKSLESDG